MPLAWEKNATLAAPILDLLCYNREIWNGIDPLVLHVSNSTPWQRTCPNISKLKMSPFSVLLSCWLKPVHPIGMRFTATNLPLDSSFLGCDKDRRTSDCRVTALLLSKSLTSLTFAHWNEVAIELWTTDMRYRLIMDDRTSLMPTTLCGQMSSVPLFPGFGRHFGGVLSFQSLK